MEVPLHDPDEAEEEVSDGDQQVGQRQVVGEVGEVDFVHLVVAVEEVGLLQEALRRSGRRVSQQAELQWTVMR